MFCCEAWFSYGVVKLLAGASAIVSAIVSAALRLMLWRKYMGLQRRLSVKLGDGDTWNHMGDVMRWRGGAGII